MAVVYLGLRVPACELIIMFSFLKSDMPVRFNSASLS